MTGARYTYKILSSSSESLHESGNHIPDSCSNSSDSIDNEQLPKTKSSFWRTLSNLIVSVEGLGLFSLPYVVEKAGWPAVAILTIMPFICCYTGIILIDCLYDSDDKHNKIRTRSNYKQLGEVCLPKYGGIVVGTIQVLYQILVESLYLVLFSSLMSGMLPSLPIPDRLWMLIAAVVVLPMSFLKHFSQVAWISLVGVIVLTVAVMLVMGFGISTSTNWNISDIPSWNIQGLPLVVPIILFSYGCHEVLPGIESNMANPLQFRKLLGFSYLCFFLIKITFALIGFLSFSSNINEVISDSLPSGTFHILTNSFIIANVIASYPMLFLITIECLEEYLSLESLRSRFNDTVCMVFIRIIVSILIFLIAIAVPHFALMMAFIGSFNATCLFFICPCIFHLRLKSTALRWYEIAIDYVIVVFGISVGIVGIYFTGNELIRSYA